MLKTIMAVGRDPVPGQDYIMRKVYKPDESETWGFHIDDEKSYLEFTRNWAY